MKLKEWFRNKYNIHYIVYILCVLIWYVVNFYRVNGTGGQWGFANELLGFTFFLMFFIRFDLKSFARIPYLFALVVSIGVFYPIFKSFAPDNDYSYRFVGRYINAVLCVIIVIRMIYYYFKESKRKISFKVSPCFFIWIIMMLFCIISKNKSTWPIYATIMFAGLYLAPICKEEKNALVRALVDGIIINFFIYQGLALLHVPYSLEHYRYRSFFSNSDCSAKFYTVSYIGFLMKYLMLKYKNTNKPIQILSILFASSMWGFLFFTMTRSGFIGMFFVTILFALIRKWLFNEKAYKTLLSGLLMLLVAIISVPIVFVAIRYIPPLRHHPIFIGDYSEDLVHSWDPIDSDKYVDIEDVKAMYFERNATGDPNDYRLYTRTMALREKYCPKPEETVNESNSTEAVKVEVSELAPNGERVISYVDGVEPGYDEAHPAYIKIKYNNRLERYLGIRKYVYAYYLRISGFRGNEGEYASGWIGNGMVYTSAHNSMLDFMSRYGYIAGVLFEIFQISLVIYSIVSLKNSRKEANLGVVIAGMIAIGYFTWGIFYSVVFTGEIMDTLFWLSAMLVMRSKEYNLLDREKGLV